MLAWENIHRQDVNNNENHSHIMINQLNNWANNMNDNDVIHRSDIVQLLAVMNTTINTVRNAYENQMNIMRREMEEQIQDLKREIRYLQNEVTYLNNSDQIQQMPAPPQEAPVEPVQAYTKEELCAELLESIEDTKEQMHDQTYRVLTDKLMEIFNR